MDQVKIMVKFTKILVFSLFSVLTIHAFAQTPVGTWMIATEDAKVEIFEVVEEGLKSLQGKITWLKEPSDKDGIPKTDVENSDAKLKTRPILGMVFLKDFKLDKSEWSGGSIYDAKSGKTYKATMKLDGDDTLKLRGYVGVPLFGRTEVWKRTQP